MLHAMQHLFIKKDKINYRSRYTRSDLDEKKTSQRRKGGKTEGRKNVFFNRIVD